MTSIAKPIGNKKKISQNAALWHTIHMRAFAKTL